MFINKPSNRRFSMLTYGLAVLILATLPVLAGCDSNDANEDETPEIEDVIISPGNASIPVGEQLDFSVAALTASGDTIPNPDLTLDWESTDPSVFTVDENGFAIAQQPGTASCLVEADDGAASKVSRAARFVGRDSAFVLVF